MNVAKGNQFELWQLGECDLRIEAWEAREIQLEVRVGAKRECLSRLEHDRTDDDAEDERNKEGLRDCLFPQCYANPGVSPLRRRTERGVRRDCCAIVSFKTARRRVVQTSSEGVRVMCDTCERSTLGSRSSSENSLFVLDAWR